MNPEDRERIKRAMETLRYQREHEASKPSGASVDLTKLLKWFKKVWGSGRWKLLFDLLSHLAEDVAECKRLLKAIYDAVSKTEGQAAKR